MCSATSIKTAWRTAHRSDGFNLLELIVSLTLVSILLVGVLTIFSRAVFIKQEAKTLSEELPQVDIALLYIRNAIEESAAAIEKKNNSYTYQLADKTEETLEFNSTTHELLLSNSKFKNKPLLFSVADFSIKSIKDGNNFLRYDIYIKTLTSLGTEQAMRVVIEPKKNMYEALGYPKQRRLLL